MAEENTMTNDNVTVTETITEEEETQHGPTLHLKLKNPKPDKKVKWSTETIDNEHMNKRKSKCCCIYEKPKLFGESSSDEDDDETDHCRGHKGKCFRHGSKHHDHNPNDDSNEAGPSS
ncbi:E3 ubiquitin-protein ligase PPP1R11-like isoform X3 [Pomacea canaliculata]|uniref:E3 ubiquitin-protein ligase PPP1R11-like isoform X3 n=1 Tax=Pomacea canaliculata TaxID=400727 RepID=UPI000D73C0B3|nr:E3 ubiquitin-protein ligase PPP1R11-like isoform X3 [Pomacea canaliculata]